MAKFSLRNLLLYKINRFAYLVAVVVFFGGVRYYMWWAENEGRADTSCSQRPSMKELQQSIEEAWSTDASGCLIRPAHAPQATKTAVAASVPAPPNPVDSNLGIARKGFATRVMAEARPHQELPRPPRELFVRSDYASGKFPDMPAYVTPDPQDGKKHPAIIWIVGGDFASFGNFWEPGPPEADESASPFREAGLIMMFPSLRGSANNASRAEYFLGEVDDVLAAAEHLARLPYVDPQRIYLGGHSTGGTLALLVAESSPRFKAVFALGPVERVDDYPRSIVPVAMAQLGDTETRLRSPIHWLDGIASPTYIIEGMDSPGNIDALNALCKRSGNPQVHCVAVPAMNHFNLIAPAARVIAARLAIEVPGIAFKLRPEDIRK